MLNLLDQLTRATQHLDSLGIASEGYLYEPAPVESIEAFEREFSLTLPRDFVSLYNLQSDGFTFSWEADDASGYAYLPALNELRLQRQSWCTDQLDCAGFKNITLDDTEHPELFPWLPLVDEGNGDLLCLDTDTGKITLWNHAVFELITLGSSLHTFLENWSRFCFQTPKGLYWPRVANDDGVDWENDEFDDRFRLD